MITEQKALEIVSTYLSQEFEVPAEKIKMDAHLFKDLELDSIDALDMVGLLEANLNIVVDEEEIKKIRTVGDVVRYIVKHFPKSGGSPSLP